ncbi:MAG TPA: hypothetical protein VJC10_02805 [Patescibacteria group bacterium]|nr:hypothetical protein [Patescibacteria group bacterium]
MQEARERLGLRLLNAKDRFLRRETQPSGAVEQQEVTYAQEYVSWFTHPPFVLVDQPQIIPGVDGKDVAQLNLIKQTFFENVQTAVEDIECLTASWVSKKENQEKFSNEPTGIVLNPVFLGTLNPDAQDALDAINRDQPDYLSDPNAKSYIHALRDSIPQVFRPYVQSVGKEASRSLGLDLEETKDQFINVVFVDDTTDAIVDLPYHWKQIFNWMMMAKFGSFKTIIARYKNNNGSLEIADTMLATLEGGHISLDEVDMVEQLAIFGSSNKSGKSEEAAEETIPTEQWQNSVAVNGLRRLGGFLGKHKLLSPAIEIKDLVGSDTLNIDRDWMERIARRTVGKVVEDGAAVDVRERFAGYSQQAEGAFFNYDPDNEWYIVTASGKFGAVKTDLQYSDLVAVQPIPGDKTKVVMLPVRNLEIKKPSVEAGEFVSPIKEFADSGLDKYAVQVRRVKGGYQIIQEGELIPVDQLRELPPITGVIHLHRDYGNFPSDEVLEVTLDDDPVVGCGVDLMEDKSRQAMEKAIEMWNAGGRKAKFAVFRVARHGLNIFTFPTADESGFIPEYTFESFEELVERKENKIVMLSTVRQEHKSGAILKKAA